MFDSEAFYDSDEGVGSGPITFKEEKARLKDKNFINPSTNRRVTTFGRLECPNATENLSAETSAQTNIVASDSSSEDTNSSIKEAVSNVIQSLDNEIIEISDDEDESEILYLSSTSSTDDDQSKPSPSTPTFKITSPTLNHNQSISSSANIAKLSDTELLQDLSALHLSPSAVHTPDESLLLQSTNNENNTANDVFIINEQSDRINRNIDYITPRDIPVEAIYSEFSDEEIEEGIKHKDSINFTKEPLEEGELACASAFNIDKTSIMVEDFDNTLDRVNFILNYGSEEEQPEDCITPQRMPSVVVQTAPNTPNLASGSTTFKVPTKIPRSLRKEFVTNRTRFDSIKSPVAHYIKNTPLAPIIQNIQCRELTRKRLLELLEAPRSKPTIKWPKVHLTEKHYNRAKIQIVPDSNTDKIFKMPANITALTPDMGVVKRHLGRQGASNSRLPVPHPIAELQDTFTAHIMRNDATDVSLVSQKNIVIE